MSHEAIEIIKAEHRSLAAVLDAANHLIAEIRAGRLTPDFRLWWAIVSYIERFPEGLHHPREDDVLFKRLQSRTDAADTLLDALEAEHRGGHERVRTLQLALGRYEAGVPDAFEDFASRIETFAQFNWKHMKMEENELFPIAERHLTEQDWEEIANAFRDNNDPMFGTQRADHFRELFRRIVNLAPPPIGLGG